MYSIFHEICGSTDPHTAAHHKPSIHVYLVRFSTRVVLHRRHIRKFLFCCGVWKVAAHLCQSNIDRNSVLVAQERHWPTSFGLSFVSIGQLTGKQYLEAELIRTNIASVHFVDLEHDECIHYGKISEPIQDAMPPFYGSSAHSIR